MAVETPDPQRRSTLTRRPFFVPTTTLAAGQILHVRASNWFETINVKSSAEVVVGVSQAGVLAGFGAVVASEASRVWQCPEVFILAAAGADVSLDGTLNEMIVDLPNDALTEANGYDGTESNAHAVII